MLFMYYYTAPSPSSVVLMSLNDDIFAGNAFNVTCTVYLPSTVDISVDIDVIWKESEPSFMIISESSVMMENTNEYVSIADVVSNVQSERISFQCAASVDSNSPFITASERRAENGSVFVVGSPSQPIGLNTSVGPTFVNITWSIKDGDNVHGYELQYNYQIRQCPDSIGMMNNIDISSNTNSHTLEHLEEDSEFNISLTAFNPAGRSEPATVTATTLSAGTVKFITHRSDN